MDANVALTAVLLRHLNEECLVLLTDGRSPWSPVRICPFAGNQRTVPSPQRSGGHQRPYLLETRPAQHLGSYGQPITLVIGESKSMPFQLLLQNAVLFQQIVDDMLLVPVEPAGRSDQEELKRLECAGHATSLSGLRSYDNPGSSIQLLDITGFTFEASREPRSRLHPATDRATDPRWGDSERLTPTHRFPGTGERGMVRRPTPG